MVCPVVAAALPFDQATVLLVVEYLRKSDIFGLAELEASAGGKTELTNLLGPYNPQFSLPLEVDDEMQALLSTHFSAEDLRPLGNIRLVTELFALHWCPARMTANIAEQLAKKHGQKFDQNSWKEALAEHGNTATETDCWIWFPSAAFWGGKNVQAQKAGMPEGFGFAHFPEAVFCMFNTFNCAKKYILTDVLTRVEEETDGYKLATGRFGAPGLLVDSSFCSSVYGRVSPVRKFCWTLALGPLATSHS